MMVSSARKEPFNAIGRLFRIPMAWPNRAVVWYYGHINYYNVRKRRFSAANSCQQIVLRRCDRCLTFWLLYRTSSEKWYQKLSIYRANWNYYPAK